MKRTRRVLALVLAVMMVAAFAPQTSFAATAKAATVYVTVNNQGVLASDNKGNVMVNRTVKVTDLNKDGKLSLDEAIYATHKAYNSTDNYEIAGNWVKKMWGTEGSFSMLKNGALTATADIETVKKNDKLYLSVNADNVTYADYYTSFDKQAATVYANRELKLALTGFSAMNGGEADVIKDAKIGIWENGEFAEIEGVKTDDNGDAAIVFEKTGTFYVTATGTVKTTAFDYSDYPNIKEVDVDAPIMAPVCKVTVKKAKAANPIKVKMTVNNKGVIAKTNKGKIMAGKTVTVKDLNKDGKMTYDEAIVAAEKAYDTADGFAVNELGWVTKLWGVESNVCNFVFLKNGEVFNTNVPDTIVKKGDVLYASVNIDDVNWADQYAYFNKKSLKVRARRDINLKLNAFTAMSGVASDDLEGVQIGTWSKGEFVPIEGAVTDENGVATFSINKKGTYYVTAKGTVGSYNFNNAKIDAPIMAPLCVIKVLPAKAAKAIKVTMTVSDQGTIASTKKGAMMFDKTVTVADINKDGKHSVHEALIATHKAYNKAGNYAFADGEATKIWGRDTNNLIGLVNDELNWTAFDETYLNAHDRINVALLQDEYAMDYYAAFDADEVTATVNTEFEMLLYGYSPVWSSVDEIEPLEGVQIGYWYKGQFEPIEGAETNEEGAVTLSFPKKGTYYITTNGTDVCDVPVIAPICKVVIK